MLATRRKLSFYQAPIVQVVGGSIDNLPVCALSLMSVSRRSSVRGTQSRSLNDVRLVEVTSQAVLCKMVTSQSLSI